METNGRTDTTDCNTLSGCLLAWPVTMIAVTQCDYHIAEQNSNQLEPAGELSALDSLYCDQNVVFGDKSSI